MNGLWKENLGGWNAKDTKRKKQTRNHKLKDNGTYVIRKFDGWRDKNKKVNPDIFRYETETVLVKKGSYGSDKPIQTTAKVYRAWATWNKVGVDGEYILDYVETYKSWYSNTPMKRNHYKTECRMVEVYTNGNWSDRWNFIEKTNESLEDYLGISKKQERTLEVTGKRDTKRTVLLPIEMVERAIERKNKIEVEDHDQDGDFIYGKPIAHWKRMTFFNDGKRRKYAQNRANRMDRRNIKKWIEDHDISKEVKSHALSKSILWEIW